MHSSSNPIQSAFIRTQAISILFFVACAVARASLLPAQLPDPSALAPSTAPNPLSDTTVNPGKVLLFDLEAKFAKDRETAAEEVLEIQDHVASAAAASAAAADECSPEMVDVSSAAFQKADDDEAKEEEQEEPVGSPLL